MSEKILIVDDDLDTLKLIGLMLQRQGYQISAANVPATALDKATSEQPDLIILDLAMPRMDGLEAVRRLRKAQATRHVPIVMVTSWDDSESVATAAEFGVDQYVVKPFDSKDLLARISKLLDRNPPRQLRSMW